MSQLDSTLHTTNDNLVYREQKESGVEVSPLPGEPIEVASMLINAKETETAIGYKFTKRRFTITDLREIAGHLILYCDSEEGVE